MSRRSKLQMAVLACVLLATAYAGAANIYWLADDVSGLWTDGGNWMGGTPPQDGDTPHLDRHNIEVTITDDVDNEFVQFYGPAVGTDVTNAVLNIEGGYLRILKHPDTNETFRMAYSAGSSGQINMSGGLLEVGDFDANGGDFQVGRSGDGKLFMTGGEIRIARNLQVSGTSTGTGHVKVYGDAVIRIGGNMTRSQFSSFVRIDVAENGKLIFSGDKQQHVSNWVGSGDLVAYNGSGRASWNITYDSVADETTVSATLDQTPTLVYWLADDVSGLWNDGDNWVGGWPPAVSGDSPYLDRNNIEVTVTDDVDVEINIMRLAQGTNIQNAVLNVNGGKMRVFRAGSNETFRIAYSTGSSGRVNMSGGLIEVGDFDAGLGDFQVGRSGAGELFMTGGEIRIARYLQVTATSTGTGHVKIYDDAVVWVGNSLFRSSGSSFVRIDIGGGQLIFHGDKRQHVQNWINDDLVVAYDGHPRASFSITYDVGANETIVTSSIPDLDLAYAPSPANGSNVQRADLDRLSWSAGDNATEHHVYFGDDEDAVLTADMSDTTGIFRGILPLGDPNYPLTEPLDLGQTYYWRVDQSDGTTIWTGDLWSFNLADYLVIDDMDDYTSGTNPWQLVSGSGSVSLNTTVRRSSPQSLKIDYWGTSDVIVKRIFDTPQNWTEEGVAALFLALKGVSHNQPADVYFRVIQGANVAEVPFADADQLAPDFDYLPWKHWNVALSAFSGVNLAQVDEIALRIAATSPGTIYMDDIRLYIPRCVPGVETYAGDISRDCFVNLEDVWFMALDWLKTGRDSYGLVGFWKFDEGQGAVAGDTSGLGNDGTLINDPVWGSQWLNFSGAGKGVVVPDSESLRVGRGDFTLAAWISPDNLTSSTPDIILAKVKDADDKEYMFSIWQGRLVLDVELAGDDGYARTNSGFLTQSSWQHVAVTFDADTLKATFYVNGQFVPNERDRIFGLPRFQDDDLYIGVGPGQYGTYGFNGLMSDVRIYDQKLSASQVEQLANDFEPTLTPVFRPLRSDADILDSGEVNINDLLEVVADWLGEEYLWPLSE